MWNFCNEDGHCYGYVMTRHFAGIDLRRIDATNQWTTNDELDGVDIVFIAAKPDSGQVVVGWYNEATVFHKSYGKRPRMNIRGDWATHSYLCRVSADRATLLPEKQRTFTVPSARQKKGFPGQSNVWYPDSGNRDVANFVTRLRRYMKSCDNRTAPKIARVPRTNGGWSGHPSEDLITRIEEAAISATKLHFKNNGYSIQSVERDNRGWDLEATKDKNRLFLEVKGHIGSVIQFELTPNEYAKLQKHADRYRVCVVRDALNKFPEVEVYRPAKKNGRWILKRTTGNDIVHLSEKTGARAFEPK